MAVDKKCWQAVIDELARWRQEGKSARLWLRDDDAVEVTPALEDYAALTNHFDMPFTLAVIPQPATKQLADWVDNQPGCSIGVHGFAHQNHAPAGQKKCETGLHRGRDVIVEELTAGRKKLIDFFGKHYVDMLVPPWNRIDAKLVDELPAIGFKCLSAYGRAHSNRLARQPFILNTHIDIIDWKGSRGGLPSRQLANRLADALTAARKDDFAVVGILTHHLIHDDLARDFLSQLFEFVAVQDEAYWVSAVDVIL
jgi:hypothetical protein